MDSTVALLFEVTGVTVISFTSLPTDAVYCVTLPLKDGESVPLEIFKEDSELSPDFAASESEEDASAAPDTVICAPADVSVAPSAFT